MRKRGLELFDNILSTSRHTTRWCVPFLRMRGNALEGAAPLCSFECQWPCFGELTNGNPSQGNIEMNQHRQCLLTMIKNSSGVIMVWEIVFDQNHSFQTPIKVLKSMWRAFQDPKCLKQNIQHFLSHYWHCMEPENKPKLSQRPPENIKILMFLPCTTFFLIACVTGHSY